MRHVSGISKSSIDSISYVFQFFLFMPWNILFRLSILIGCCIDGVAVQWQPYRQGASAWLDLTRRLRRPVLACLSCTVGKTPRNAMFNADNRIKITNNYQLVAEQRPSDICQVLRGSEGVVRCKSACNRWCGLYRGEPKITLQAQIVHAWRMKSESMWSDLLRVDM